MNQATVSRLVADGVMEAQIRIPGAAGTVAGTADLRTSEVRVCIQVGAPREGSAQRRVSWLLRQLKEAPGNLLVEVRFSGRSEGTSGWSTYETTRSPCSRTRAHPSLGSWCLAPRRWARSDRASVERSFPVLQAPLRRSTPKSFDRSVGGRHRRRNAGGRRGSGARHGGGDRNKRCCFRRGHVAGVGARAHRTPATCPRCAPRGTKDAPERPCLRYLATALACGFVSVGDLRANL